MNWNDVVTQKQKEELIQEAEKDLKTLLKIPAVKDMLSNKKIILGEYEESGSYGSLYLTKDGLFKETGFHDSCCFDGGPNMSHSSGPFKINTDQFREVIETYQLTPESIDKVKKLLV